MRLKPVALFLVLILLGTSFHPNVAFAQPTAGQNSANTGAQKHLSTIVFAGVAGAILGLSTLSFYGRPQERLSHIAIGAAIGIIGGTMVSTYRAATESSEYYGLREFGPSPELWATLDRSSGSANAFTPSTGLTFEF